MQPADPKDGWAAQSRKHWQQLRDRGWGLLEATQRWWRQLPERLRQLGIEALVVLLALGVGVALGNLAGAWKNGSAASSGSKLGDSRTSQAVSADTAHSQNSGPAARTDQAQTDTANTNSGDNTSSSPATENNAPSGSKASNQDWAQHAPLPPWVRDTAFQTTPRPRPREPVGSQNFSGTRPHNTEQPSTPKTPTTNFSADQLEPVWVRRTSGQRLQAYPLNSNTSGAPEGDFRLLGECSERIQLNNRQGREQGSTGSWLFGLGVRAPNCRKASSFTATRRPPTREERRRLSYITQSSTVARKLGAPAFSAADLTDFAAYSQGEEKLAFGVFRRQMNTTQISPPPPIPQLAFIALQTPREGWQILWGTFTSDPARRLGLAGVFDQDGNGVLDAYFGVSGGGQPVKALHISSQDGLSWEVAEVIPFSS